MPMVDKVLGALGLARKAGPPRGPVDLIARDSVRINGTYTSTGGATGGAWQYGYSTPDYLRLAQYAYGRNSDVYACVSLIGNAAKQVKWWDGTPGRSKTPENLLLKTIERRSLKAELPNLGWRAELAGAPGGKAASGGKRADPTESLALLAKSGGPTFVEDWVTYMLLAGNAFNELEREGSDGKGRPIWCYLDRPDRVRANPPSVSVPVGSRPGSVYKWEVTLNGGSRKEVEPFNRQTGGGGGLIHSRLFNPVDDIYGMPPLLAAMLQIAAQNEGGKLLGNLFDKGYSPAWVEITGDNWNENKQAALRQNIAESKQAGKELIMEGAAWHSLAGAGSSDLTEAVIGQHNLTKRDIASVYHVDPILIGDTESRTYATYQESRRALYMEAVLPLLGVFVKDWNATIGAELNSPLDFDRDSFDAIAQARAEASERVTRLFTNGIIDQPEARADLEYPEPTPRQTFYAPASMVPLSELGGEEV